MKALVLAGGYARRLAPLTDFVSKPLLPLGDKLVIDFVIERLRELPVDEVIVSTNSYYEKQFRYWSRCRGEDITLVIEPTRGEEEKFGAIAGMRYVMDTVGRDEYIIAAGDNVFDFSLQPMYDLYSRVKAPVIAVYDVGDLDKAKRYGVVSISEDGLIREMQEKPEKPKSTLVSTAIYIFPREAYDWLSEYLSGKNNPDSPGYFLSWLYRKRKVYAYPFTGLWKDIGNLDEYREIFEKMLR
jgi:glucose-1-phosphate thymidylyltransferase